MKNRSWMIKVLLGSVVLALFLAGCGSSHDSEPLLTGIFVDDVVEGLEFRAGDRVGFTDAEGKFYYRESETVSFYVGGIKIGETSDANPMTTPIDLVDADNSFVLHPTVTNISRFLQSLDEDGLPGNGIRITRETRDRIQALVDNEGFTISFTDDAAFSSQASLLIDSLNEDPSVFKDSLGNPSTGSLTSPYAANQHFFSSLAKRLATPVVMINLGDGLTAGAQSGFGNVFSSTQLNGYAGNIAFQLQYLSMDASWNNPYLMVNSENYDVANSFERTYYRTKDDEEAEAIVDQYRTPYNLAVPGATAKSLISEDTSQNEMLDELLRPIPEMKGSDADPMVERDEVTQLEAALYLANLEDHQKKLKIFTLWIGMEDTLRVVTANYGSDLTAANINAFLGDTAAGHDLATVTANITSIVNQLRSVEYAQVFIGTIPHVETLGILFSKTDIERMARFDSAAVDSGVMTNQLIGYQPFLGGNFAAPPETAIASALNKDNVILNQNIALALTNDANFLDSTEIGLINARIDAVNALITGIANASSEDNVYLVDLKTDVYDRLTDPDGLDIMSIRPEDDNDLDEDLHVKTSLIKTMAGGFYSHDGYHPGHTGYGVIGFTFMNRIAEAGIGFDLDATFVYEVDGGTYPALDLDITDIVVLDPYTYDGDGDHFVGSPGYAIFGSEDNDVHGYDAVHFGGWIDCNNFDETVLPFYISGPQLDEGETETDSPCYYIVPDYTVTVE